MKSRRPRLASRVLGAALFCSAIIGFINLAHGEVEVESIIRRYDDTRTQVTSPSVDVSGTFNHDTMKVTAGWAEDIVSSASADVISYASKGRIYDRRIEFSGGYESQIPDGTINVGYIQSKENDYESHTYTAGGTREFNTKNTVFSFGFASGHDHVRSSSDPSFDKPMENQSYALSLTQVLTKVDIIQFIYDFRVENGCLYSPYRRAKLDVNGVITAIPEAHPETRNRTAAAVKFNHYIERWHTTWANTYRLYDDSWGVLSHTLEERLTKEIGRKTNLSLVFRYYTQGQASFYQDYYMETAGPFHTGNNTLATYHSYLVGIRPSYQVTDHLSLFGNLQYFVQTFANATDAHNPYILTDDVPLKINAVAADVGLMYKF